MSPSGPEAVVMRTKQSISANRLTHLCHSSTEPGGVALQHFQSETLTHPNY